MPGFTYDPAKGKYSLAVMNVLRELGALTLALVGGLIIRSLVQERRRRAGVTGSRCASPLFSLFSRATEEEAR